MKVKIPMTGQSSSEQASREKLPDGQVTPLVDRIRWDWIAVAISLVMLSWLITEGDWNFFPKAGFLENFYDGQAQSLLHGRIDVAPEAIGPEAFLRNGKAYGYYGPTPALIRIPLQLLFPGMHGRWNCLSMLLASVLMITMLSLLMNRVEKLFPIPGRPYLRHFLRAALILAVAIGSTNYYVSSERKMYQEAIIWSSSLAFAHAVFLFFYLMNPRPRWLVLSCLMAFLAIFSRLSSGAGPLFSLLLVDVAILLPSVRFRSFWTDSNPPRRAAIIISFTLIASAVFCGGLNYWKFGQVSIPISMNKQFDQQRMERIKGKIVSLNNLPITLSSYLSPGNIIFTGNFPWAFLTMGDTSLLKRFPKASFDIFEPFASLPAAMPGIFLSAIAGTVICFRSRSGKLKELRAPLAGTIAGFSITLIFSSVTYRYEHDFFPWLAFGSAIGVAWIPGILNKSFRYILSFFFVVATAYAMFVNFAFAIWMQRYVSYPIRPEKRIEFTDFCSVINTHGLKGALWYGRHWHLYIPASAFQGGNLQIDRTRLAERYDQPVLRSQGDPPYVADYTVDLPTNGIYEIAIRYAAAEPRPVYILVNGYDLKEVCGTPTGGWLHNNQAWALVGLFKLNGGTNNISLLGYGPFPPISMLRVIRIERQ